MGNNIQVYPDINIPKSQSFRWKVSKTIHRDHSPEWLFRVWTDKVPKEYLLKGINDKNHGN